MKTISETIKNGRILISDGAWGTLLHQKGLRTDECPELWNLERPDDVFDIAKSYIDAGSDMIETNSFGANSFKLALYGLQGRVVEINRAAAAISRRAAGLDCHVLGSMGPTGKIILMGDVTPNDLYETFKEQAMALEAGGADALVIETMSDLEEAIAAVHACRENTSCEVICTMTFEKSGDHVFHTMMGVTPAQMTRELTGAGAHIIGANCGHGIQNMIGITREIRSINRDIPVLIHANAGAPIYRDGQTIFPESPREMSEYARFLVDAGANIIGGCCGTTPEHIRMIAENVRKTN